MSLTIATVNVNGIRAATKVRNEENLGMLAWLAETPADVVLMQEVRASEQQARAALALMAERDLPWLPVVDGRETRRLVGIVHERDIHRSGARVTPPGQG